MGKLVEGVWHDVWYDTKSSGGKFVREDAGPMHSFNQNLGATIFMFPWLALGPTALLFFAS